VKGLGFAPDQQASGRNGLLRESARGPRSRSKLAMLRPQSAEWCLDLSRNPQSRAKEA